MFQAPETFHVSLAGMLRKSFLEGLPEIKLEKGLALCKNRLFQAGLSVRDEADMCVWETGETGPSKGRPREWFQGSGISTQKASNVRGGSWTQETSEASGQSHSPVGLPKLWF